MEEVRSSDLFADDLSALRAKQRRLLRGLESYTLEIARTDAQQFIAKVRDARDASFVEYALRLEIERVHERIAGYLEERLTATLAMAAADFAKSDKLVGDSEALTHEITRLAEQLKARSQTRNLSKYEEGAEVLFAFLAVLADECADDGYRDPRLGS